MDIHRWARIKDSVRLGKSWEAEGVTRICYIQSKESGKAMPLYHTTCGVFYEHELVLVPTVEALAEVGRMASNWRPHGWHLPAGQDLDALIAEMVMGWHRPNNARRWCVLQEGPRLGSGQVTEESQTLPVAVRHENEWHPSTDIAHAFEVVRKLAENLPEDRSYCHFDLMGPSNRKPISDWLCSFTPYLGFDEGYYAEGETASLAICRAALLVKPSGAST